MLHQFLKPHRFLRPSPAVPTSLLALVSGEENHEYFVAKKKGRKKNKRVRKKAEGKKMETGRNGEKRKRSFSIQKTRKHSHFLYIFFLY